MKWLEHLLRLKDRLRHSRKPKPTEPVAINMTPLLKMSPPVDWSDIAGWNRYLQAKSSDGPLRVPTVIGAQGWQSVRFLSFVRKRGGRVWFPGCGIDPGPRFYAYVGGTGLATDFSPVAVRVQGKFAELAPEIMFADWSSFLKNNAPFENCGRFEIQSRIASTSLQFLQGQIPLRLNKRTSVLIL